ncbi:MAG: hypothetical protein WBM02_10335 [bacterium]
MTGLRIPDTEVKERAHRRRFTRPCKPTIPHEADLSAKRGELGRCNRVLFEIYQKYLEQYVKSIPTAPKLLGVPCFKPSETPLINKEIHPE